eukprot:TRINITY_DN17114_c0_g1_i2.p1 TRINITY_DN17114_c0_g1~~TRINITY_DN17114_c0_g1_i2.p1  ORF type:complete len:654 (+),score=76.26 TRINITY_DN17114_c0_g1_i2:135-2096(+)
MRTDVSSASDARTSVNNWVNTLPGIDANDNKPPMRPTRRTKTTMPVDEVLTKHGAKRDRDRWVINPEVQQIMQYWDMTTILALAFVAVATPFEVALLETEVNLMFVLNRLTDAIFTVDLVLQFFVAYRVKTRYGHRLETRMRQIAKHYLTTWFIIDLVSVIPYDSLGLILQSPVLQRARTLKIIKLLRLIKLARVLRASRIFQRWETVMHINYNQLNLWTAIIMFGIGSHWIACMWSLLATQAEEGQRTWVDHAIPAAGDKATGPAEIYFTSMYWSAMTVTSIGYGDVLPVNLTERIACIFLMFGSSFLWARVLSDTMSAIANGDTHKLQFRQTLDDLNYMMADQKLPNGMRRRLRAFFFQTQDLQRVQSFQSVIQQMSPALQGELALTVNEVWVRKVWYLDTNFDKLPVEFVVGVAGALRIAVFAQQEFFGEPWTLYILHRGLCVRSMRILRSGSVWGEDFVLSLDSHDLINTLQVCALTFVEVASMTRASFKGILEKFPTVRQLIRKATVRIAVRAGILKEAERRKTTSAGRRSHGFLMFAGEDAPVFDRHRSIAFSQQAADSTDDKLQAIEEKQEKMQKQLDKLTDLMERLVERVPQQFQQQMPAPMPCNPDAWNPATMMQGVEDDWGVRRVSDPDFPSASRMTPRSKAM